MKFLYPAFLYALAALAIPVIIHLFNFRKFRKYYFPNVRFLKEVKQETHSRSKLKHLLVLLSRLLAIAFLVFAFARPYIPTSENANVAGKKIIGMYIDNSFSMEAVGEEGELLETAKQKAIEIASAYNESDRFVLTTNDFLGKHHRPVNRDRMIDYIEEIRLSPAVVKLSEAVDRLSASINKTETAQRHLYLLSDFQKITSDPEQLKKDSNLLLNLFPLNPVKTENLYIDSCWFANPIRQYGQPEKLRVSIRTQSDKAYSDVPVSLTVNGRPKTPGTFSIEPEGEATVTLTYTNDNYGIQQGKISIKDYPVTFDDDYYFSYKVIETIKVTTVNHKSDSANALRRLYESDSLFDYREINAGAIDYTRIGNSQTVILNGLKDISSGLAGELRKFVKKGGSLVVFPSAEIDINSYEYFLSSLQCDTYRKIDTTDTEVNDINLNHQLFQNVFEEVPENMDLPAVSSHYKTTSLTRTGKENIMKLRNGDNFFSQYTYEKGKVYLSSVPLGTKFSNLTNHAIFVPLMFNTALFSIHTQQLSHTIGTSNVVSTDHNKTDESVYHITRKDFDFIPEVRVSENRTQLYIHDQIIEAGNYQLTYQNKNLKGVSFNFSRKESNLDNYNQQEIEDQLKKAGIKNYKLLEGQTKNITQKIAVLSEGKQLWKLCIILALVFIAAEVLLLKFWRK